jgi:hypothetical protein
MYILEDRSVLALLGGAPRDLTKHENARSRGSLFTCRRWWPFGFEYSITQRCTIPGIAENVRPFTLDNCKKLLEANANLKSQSRC